MSFTRISDWLARALLPLLLLSLTLLQELLADQRQAGGCRRMVVLRSMRHVGEIDPEVDAILHDVVSWGEATLQALFVQARYLSGLTFAFALAYLLFARERTGLRIGVAATVLLTPVLAVAFGSIC